MPNGPSQLPFAFAFAGEARFDSFICQRANAALYGHLQQLPNNTGGFTWLWGSAGTGKSHLSQALCQGINNTLYLPMRKLLEYPSDCLLTLHDADFLVIDDIDLAVGQPRWEEQLFALSLELLANGATLVCTAKQPPAQVPFLLKDLQSRMQLALVYEVTPLDETGRAALLVSRAAVRGIELKEEVVQYILARHSRSVHDLMHVLDQLDRQALAEQRRITIPFVRACLGW